jgi:hypothetical protein
VFDKRKKDDLIKREIETDSLRFPNKKSNLKIFLGVGNKYFLRK